MLDYKINTFLTLCNELNYRVTAEKLNMTQPAVTNHIQSLENLYGVKLFSYTNRKLTKTDECILIEKHARAMMYNQNELVKQLKQEKNIHYNIGATKTIGSFVIAPLIANAIKQNNVSVTLLVENTKILLDKLDKSEIDFALIEGRFNDKNYGHKLLHREKLVGICCKHHEFCNKKITINELINQNMIMREKGSGSRDIFVSALKTRNFSLENFKEKVIANDISAIQSLVSSGAGVSFVYESVAKNNDALSTFTIEELDLYGEFNFVYLLNTNQDKLLQKFYRHII